MTVVTLTSTRMNEHRSGDGEHRQRTPPKDIEDAADAPGRDAPDLVERLLHVVEHAGGSEHQDNDADGRKQRR